MSPAELDRTSRKPYPDTPSGIMRLPPSFKAAAAAARYFDPASREAQAESITVRIRWFGLCVGYLYVNLVERSTGRPELNGMLTLGRYLRLARHARQLEREGSTEGISHWYFVDGGVVYRTALQF